MHVRISRFLFRERTAVLLSGNQVRAILSAFKRVLKEVGQVDFEAVEHSRPYDATLHDAECLLEFIL